MTEDYYTEDSPNCSSGLTRIDELEMFGPLDDFMERLKHSREDERKTMPYREYLQTEWWQELRRSKIRSVGFRCQRCGTNRRTLDVHHLTYARRGYELREDLVVLCRSCHLGEHSA